MNYRQLMEENDYIYPYSYGDEIDVATQTTTTSFEISVGNLAFYASTISATVIDSDGKILDPNNNNDVNYLTIQITDESGNNWFKSPICIFDFQKWANNHNFKGIVLPAQKKYTITISSAAFPAVLAITYPLRVSVFFIGLNRTEKAGQSLTPSSRVLI